MEHFQILIYIVIGIIWFIFRSFNKNTEDERAGKTPPISDNLPFPPKKAGSLEEMIKEIGRTAQQTKQQASQQQAQTRQKAATIQNKTERRINEPGQGKVSNEGYSSYEQIPTADQQTGREYVPVYTNEASGVDYEDPEKAQYKGLDDQRKRFTPFEQGAKPKNAIGQLLRNPSNAKTAFILSEIFNRKY
jgi:hypothetical protein